MVFNPDAPEVDVDTLPMVDEGDDDKTLELRLAVLDKMIKKWLGTAAKADIDSLPDLLDMNKNSDFKGLENVIALRLFTKHYQDFLSMMETLQSICEEDDYDRLSPLVDSFTLMMETFCEYVDKELCEKALTRLLLGVDVEEFPDEIGDDGLNIDVSYL
jgi:hypothetical protein